MSLCGCNFKCNCAFAAILVSVFVGVIATFLQITATIIIAPAFLWVAFGVAVVYLAVLAAGFSSAGRSEACCSKCSTLNVLLLGILGTILFALVLLAVGIVATSLLSAILVGILLFFFALMLTSTACYVKCLTDCDS